ncbi:acylneuraminate cytidylyltransferase family protein [Polaribacter sp. HaHaR_3_91]|uniref:acylneuraminate cytidylyltransferase family protein n=1 Tax=Polaribacter sp. HaHaR_3_91 TaxID=2745561 RepID=UPI001C4FDE71|nr:acylneuraminate cytidylyltransferase family protein [Polaribacter sp. HaHaR_3_91]QXP64999.1 acylneuraminate cytidylyltransferase family protein [Polaribacter sp. HaHaR_3_91]
MRILGLIPARGGSKGVPGKNIKLLGKKTLLQYTSEIALASKYLSKVVLSSDDDAIIAIAKELGVEVPFKRPSNLAEDASPTLPVIKHALQFYKDKGEHFDAVCLLQVTSPFRTLEFLDEAINKFLKKGTDSLVSVQEVPHEYNPHWTFKMNDEGNLKITTGEKNIISRRQELPITYHRDGSVYLTKTNVIEEHNSLFGDSMAFMVTPKEDYVNIDTLKDWEKAESILNNK